MFDTVVDPSRWQYEDAQMAVEDYWDEHKELPCPYELSEDTEIDSDYIKKAITWFEEIRNPKPPSKKDSINKNTHVHYIKGGI